MSNLRVQLPSRGKCGLTHVCISNPKISNIREFLSFEGKVLSAINQFVQSLCDSNINDILVGDRDYLVVNLRRLINPDAISGNYLCEICDTLNSADLPYSQIEVRQLPDDLPQPADLRLPVSGKPIRLKLVTVKMEQDIEDFLELQETTDTKDEYLASLGASLPIYVRYAVMIQDEKLTLTDKIKMLDELDYNDFEYISMFEASFPVGPMLVVDSVCKKCGNRARVSFPIDSHFLGLNLKSMLNKYRFLLKTTKVGFNDFLSFSVPEADTLVTEEMESRKKLSRGRG